VAVDRAEHLQAIGAYEEHEMGATRKNPACVNDDLPGNMHERSNGWFGDEDEVVHEWERCALPRAAGKLFSLGSLFLAALSVSACHGIVIDEVATGSSSSATASSGGSCAAGSFGDPTKPIELVPVAFDPNHAAVELVDGAEVPILKEVASFPGIRIAAKVTNISACSILVGIDLRVPGTGESLHAGQQVELQAIGDGWGGPGDSRYDFVPVALCPTDWTSAAVVGNSFDLTVTVSNLGGPSESRTVQIAPYCAEPENEAYCACICAQGNVDPQKCL
jgi:hypothetical protein